MNNFSVDDGNNANTILFDLNIYDDKFDFESSIFSALSSAECELEGIKEKISETYTTVKKLTPECDKLDYMLAACSGMLCSIMDIFLVGKPDESPIGNLTDKYFENRTKDFARHCGWKDDGNKPLSSAIRYLEEHYNVPYDQRGAGDAGRVVFDLNTRNHHIKSLAHNPTLLGLYFSIVDQFTNSSHFVSNGELIELVNADNGFVLNGKDVPSKLYCALSNWIGHLISDMSGSAQSKGRGMGIPSPLWAWSNDIIAIKRKLNIPILEFDKTFNEVALKLYKKGYDARFQATQAIPVFINEMLVRLIYSTRRVIRYYLNTQKEDRSLSSLWKTCEPFSNASIKKMLTVAHGTFCILDIGDAVVQGAINKKNHFDISEIFMRVNIIGIGHFGISIYEDIKYKSELQEIRESLSYIENEKTIINDYIEGLRILAHICKDSHWLTFVDDLQKSDMYIQAFTKTAELAEKRNVPSDSVLKTKADIDKYFRGGHSQ